MNITEALAGLFSGIIGAMGLGGGAVLIIYLAVFTDTKQLTSQGINLLFFIPIALLAVIIYVKNKKINFKLVIPLAIGGILGCIFGIIFAKLLGGALLSKAFGAFLCALGIKEIISAFCAKKHS